MDVDATKGAAEEWQQAEKPSKKYGTFNQSRNLGYPMLRFIAICKGHDYKIIELINSK